jgi:hypothetical protein
MSTDHSYSTCDIHSADAEYIMCGSRHENTARTERRPSMRKSSKSISELGNLFERSVNSRTVSTFPQIKRSYEYFLIIE